jgi:hypothetical protein
VNFILDSIAGPYPFLLIFQILIVAALMLVLIWLLAQRAREMEAGSVLHSNSAPHASPAPTPSAPANPVESVGAVAMVSVEAASAVPAPAPPGAPDPSAGEVKAVVTGGGSGASGASPSANASAANNAATSALLAERDAEVQKLSTESAAMKDKIRYLESRLMEYEIVQEEISNLAALRSENEKLKQELLSSKGAKPSEVSAPVSAPTPVAPPPPVEATKPPEPIQTIEAANPMLEAASKTQIDSILQKLDEITEKKPS